MPATVTEAERLLFEAAFFDRPAPAAKPQFQGNGIHHGLHHFGTFFLGDVIAYVSADVNVIRRTVWEQMWLGNGQPGLCQLLKNDPDATYSIIAHSLGSVIAFDYLACLFQDHDPANPKPDSFLPDIEPHKRPEDTHLQGARSRQDELLDPTDPAIRSLLQDRFRYFFTLGSPIGLFMLRHGRLWLDQQPFHAIFNPVRGGHRAWCNFYDRADGVAYPLNRIFNLNSAVNHTCNLDDIRVRNWGVPLMHSHVGYWTKPYVAQRIVEVLQSARPVTAPSGLQRQLSPVP